MKKYMHWDLYFKEFRYAKVQRKVIPFFHTCENVSWNFKSSLALMFMLMSTRLKPSLIVQGDSLKWIIKFLPKNTTFYKIRESPGSYWTSLLYFLSSADNFCKQFGPRLALTECRSWSGFYWSWSWSKIFDTLAPMMFMKTIEKINFEKKKNSRWKQMHEKSPSMQIINRHLIIRHNMYYLTFWYCKGGTSWMCKQDWSTLDIGKSWKWGVVSLKSNCIILGRYLSIDLVLKRQKK